MCALIKLNFLFWKRKPLLDALPNVYPAKPTFDLSDVFVVTVIARNRINGVGSLFFRDRILNFGTFNVVAIQNSIDGFRNTLNVRNNSNASRWFPFIGSVTSCDWFLAVTEKSVCIATRL